jgi:monoamine oxidase
MVVGAGFAGLHAARLLEAEGMRIVVLEADGRVGGRVLTLEELPGAPNAGGSQVGASYGRMRATAADLGVSIKPDAPVRPASALFVAGKLIPESAWTSAVENPFRGALRSLLPAGALTRLASQDNPIEDPATWRTLGGSRHDVSASTWLSERGVDDAARELIDVGLNANSLDNYSMVNLFRTLALFKVDGRLGAVGNVEGGSQKLAEAMAASLRSPLRLASQVRALATTERGVEATLLSGERVHAAFAIAALPAPALHRIALEAPIPPLQKVGIANLPYTQIAHLYLEPETPFWEWDGLPPDMWTDTPLERIFSVRDRATGANTGTFLAWINGAGAGWLRGQSDAAIEKMAQQTLNRVRPASGGRVRLRKIVRWTSDNALAGGAYHHWAPGQIGRWAEAINRPAGRIHFAGEHLAVAHTGMEAAFESGEAAALQVLAAAR